MLSPFLFLLVMSLITKESMDSKGNVIRWKSGKSLEDFKSADDLALLSYFFDHNPVFEPLQTQLSGIKVMTDCLHS